MFKKLKEDNYLSLIRKIQNNTYLLRRIYNRNTGKVVIYFIKVIYLELLNYHFFQAVLCLYGK